VRFQDACLELLKSDAKISSFVNTRQLPMLVEPKPWSSPDSGGYLHYPSFFMRVRHSMEHKQKLREVARQGALDKVFRGLNALGAVQWEINTKVRTRSKDSMTCAICSNLTSESYRSSL
jgi:DNA-directed RNA polymerase